MSGISFSKTNARVGGAEFLTQPSPRPEVSFIPVWEAGDRHIAKDAIQYWRKYQLVREQDFEERVAQICAAAYAGTELVGLSTAEPTEWMQLPFLDYRCSIAPNFRRREITWRLTAYTYQLLEQWSLQQPIDVPAGLIVTLEARQFIGHMGPPVISKHGMDLVFVGRNETGHQVRAIWFKHADCEAIAVREIHLAATATAS